MGDDDETYLRWASVERADDHVEESNVQLSGEVENRLHMRQERSAQGHLRRDKDGQTSAAAERGDGESCSRPS